MFVTMVIGSLLGAAASRTAPARAIGQFFGGMGQGFSSIVAVMVCAGVFVEGLRVVGIIDAVLCFLRDSRAAVPWIGALGPMVFAVGSGSGDAAASTFNMSVTPHASALGVDPLRLGSLAWISAELGRCMSPVAAVTLAIAGIARVEATALVRHTLLPVLAGAAVAATVLWGIG